MSGPQLGKPPVVVLWEHLAQHLRELGAEVGAGLLDRLLPRLRHHNYLHGQEPFDGPHGIALPELHMVTAFFLL
jgi:hypothetical protein